MEAIDKLRLAEASLLGLSIGDAFGETFFGPEETITNRIRNRKLQEGKWLFTDDTVMGIGIYNILYKYGEINQDQLAREFADNYILDDCRGYGGTAHGILRDLAAGKPWKEVSSAVFDGMGSMGNGAAMRSGLIGAYFHEQEEKVIEQATLAAKVTHFHHEAIAGAIAVALAACICTRFALTGKIVSADQFFNFIVENMPESDVKYKIKKAATLPENYEIRTIVSILGNGVRLTAQDTVPFALWCAARHIDDYEEAIWTAVSGLGDRDTISAIVGSIVVLTAGQFSIPLRWVVKTEQFDDSPFFKERGAKLHIPYYGAHKKENTGRQWEREKKKIIDYPPETLRTFKVLRYEWIDNLCFTLDPRECLDTPDQYIKIAEELLSNAGWDGVGVIELMWIPPFMFYGYSTKDFTVGVTVWHVKQNDDGISWILHPKKCLITLWESMMGQKFKKKLASLSSFYQAQLQAQHNIP